MNGLLLHGSCETVNYETLKMVALPTATQSYTPIAHHELLDAVTHEITSSGLTIANQELALSNASNGRYGDRFFGLLEIKSEYADYSLLCGLRNSHDKVIPAGLCVGSRVFVCSNLAFSSEVVIARKHTRFIERDLPRLINRAVGRLGDLRDQQHNRIEAYQNTSIDDVHFHDMMIRSVDLGIICASKLPKVLSEYRQPQHEAFLPRTVYSAFNAVTEVLKGVDIQDLPRRTQWLHGLCDMISGLAPLNAGANN